VLLNWQIDQKGKPRNYVFDSLFWYNLQNEHSPWWVRVEDSSSSAKTWFTKPIWLHKECSIDFFFLLGDGAADATDDDDDDDANKILLDDFMGEDEKVWPASWWRRSCWSNNMSVAGVLDDDDDDNSDDEDDEEDSDDDDGENTSGGGGGGSNDDDDDDDGLVVGASCTEAWTNDANDNSCCLSLEMVRCGFEGLSHRLLFVFDIVAAVVAVGEVLVETVLRGLNVPHRVILGNDFDLRMGLDVIDSVWSWASAVAVVETVPWIDFFWGDNNGELTTLLDGIHDHECRIGCFGGISADMGKLVCATASREGG
jgi:hypothetical protein